jgi:hypothetical protein
MAEYGKSGISFVGGILRGYECANRGDAKTHRLARNRHLDFSFREGDAPQIQMAAEVNLFW